MSNCDGCGQLIGHAESIEAEYHSENLDRENYYFGCRECKEIFEDEHDVVEKTECHQCGKIIKKENTFKDIKVVSGINCKVEYCEECAENPEN